jgi:NTP pyrophosphatase (non-canonical NTP hydrolase)
MITKSKTTGELMLTNEFTDFIRNYYTKRGLAWPNFEDAMKFVATEIGEVYEVDLSRNPTWVRNNPQDKPTFSKEQLASELGDVIMMVMVAGIVEGVDPLDALVKKINRKLAGLNNQMQFPKDSRGIEYYDAGGKSE